MQLLLVLARGHDETTEFMEVPLLSGWVWTALSLIGVVPSQEIQDKKDRKSKKLSQDFQAGSWAP